MLPPFEKSDGAVFSTIEWWDTARYGPAAGENVEGTVQEIALTPEQAVRIADCLKAVQVVASYAAFDAGICDGGTTKLSIAQHRASAVRLEWSNSPPAEWIGVDALLDAINEPQWEHLEGIRAAKLIATRTPNEWDPPR